MTDHLKPHQFKPGVSGNPGGRPKGLERTAREAMAMREYTDSRGVAHKGADAAFACLIDMFFDDDTPPRERIAAFKEWCDRGYGKAKQSIKLEGDPASNAVEGRKPEDMSDEELASALEAIRTLKKLGAVATDVSEH